MDRLTIGNIIKPQGIKGEVKVKPFTDTPEDIKNFREVYIGEEKYKLLYVRIAGEFAYVGLRGVADRNAAELLRGKDITADREEAPSLEEGKYYIVDIIGCRVRYAGGESIGVITEVTPAATDIYTVERGAGEKPILFPAVKGVVINVDIKNKEITVDKKRFLQVAVS